MLKPQWFQILLSLAAGERHGLAIRDEVLARTDGEMHLWPATLYRSLQKLDELGLIREVGAPVGAEAVGAPRFYAITASGRATLARHVELLEGFVREARARRVHEV